jgi:hydroxymethylbilane synthase
LEQLNHEPTAQTTVAERAIAKFLQASCQSPVATHAVIDAAMMTVTALVAMPDGSESIRDIVRGAVSDAEKLGLELAERLLARGAGELLAAAGAAND